MNGWLFTILLREGFVSDRSLTIWRESSRNKNSWRSPVGERQEKSSRRCGEMAPAQEKIRVMGLPEAIGKGRRSVS